MDRPNETPIPPWEQELAAQALAELKQGGPSEFSEAAALKSKDSAQLIAEVDRMIADKRADLERLQRLPSTPLALGRDAGATGLTLGEVGKPACIVFLLVIIVLAGLLLSWMAGQISATLKERPGMEGQVQELTPEETAP